MAQVRSNGPTPAAPAATIPSDLNAQIDLMVSLHLFAWPALTLAVQNAWGGDKQTSSDKRDWLAGAVSDLLTSNPPQIADVSDLEEVLLQVMNDEFEIVVDDGSAEEVARKIWGSAEILQGGDATELTEMYAKWQDTQTKGGEKLTGIVRGEDKEEDETDWDDEDDDEEGEDVELMDAPSVPALPKQKVEPEIDEDGFTKVVSKKKR
jgi:pre-rRNA-processing protein TSR2